MGNCLIKHKNNYSEQVEAEIFFLQKENLRSFDYLLHEIKTLKSTVQNLQFSNSVIEPQIITYV